MRRKTNRIDGRALAQAELARLKQELKSIGPIQLTTINVGRRADNLSYLKIKTRLGRELGIKVTNYQLPKSASVTKGLQLIERLNQDQAVQGILVQLPLPPTWPQEEIINRINPEKDVDCLHPVNFGRFSLTPQLDWSSENWSQRLLPPTARAVLTILKTINYSPRGRRAVVVGQGNLAGKPISLLLSQLGATVISANEFTPDLARETRRAEILVSATGQPKLIQGAMVSPGVIALDLGFSRIKGKIQGDLDFDSVALKANWITPVPGGVGPITVSSLFANLILLAKRQDTKERVNFRNNRHRLL